MLIGDSDVGKSSFLLRFTDGIYQDGNVSTIGIDFRFKNLKVNNKATKLQIWDTAGQERFKTITSAYYRGADGIVVVYDICSKASFDHVRSWLEEASRYTSEDICNVIVGNKSDLDEQRVVSTEEGKVSLFLFYCCIISLVSFVLTYLLEISE